MTTRLLAAARLLILRVLAVAVPSAVKAQPLVPSGAEFQVNSFTLNAQNFPAISADGDGDFVVVWASERDGSDYGIFGQRWSSAGVRLGTEFQVNSTTNSTQTRPSVAAEDDGGFVVAWFSLLQDDGDSGGIFARRFSADGTPQGIEFQVNTYTVYDQDLPAAASDADGDFVIAWSSRDGQDGGETGVFARRFDSAGVAQAIEFQVNSYTTSHQEYAAVSSGGGGSFVITWSSHGQDGSYDGIFARRFDSAGGPQATEFQVNAFTTSNQYLPSIAHDGAGQFVITWTSLEQDGSQQGVFARRFASTGAVQGAEFQVNAFTANDQSLSRVAFDSAGDFAVVWQGSGVSGAFEVFARAFDGTGTPKGSDFQVNSTLAGIKFYPVVASTGSFVVAWVSGGDGSSVGIVARRLAASALPTLDLDGSGAIGPLTDGLLFLRYLFQFSGTTLTSGAVNVGTCTRCDGAAIAEYVDRPRARSGYRRRPRAAAVDRRSAGSAVPVRLHRDDPHRWSDEL